MNSYFQVTRYFQDQSHDVCLATSLEDAIECATTPPLEGDAIEGFAVACSVVPDEDELDNGSIWLYNFTQAQRVALLEGN